MLAKVINVSGMNHSKDEEDKKGLFGEIYEGIWARFISHIEATYENGNL